MKKWGKKWGKIIIYFIVLFLLIIISFNNVYADPVTQDEAQGIIDYLLQIKEQDLVDRFQTNILYVAGYKDSENSRFTMLVMDTMGYIANYNNIGCMVLGTNKKYMRITINYETGDFVYYYEGNTGDKDYTSVINFYAAVVNPIFSNYDIEGTTRDTVTVNFISPPLPQQPSQPSLLQGVEDLPVEVLGTVKMICLTGFGILSCVLLVQFLSHLVKYLGR